MTDISRVDRNAKVLLIDGHNLFIRMHSALPTTNDAGKHVGGITGFLNGLSSAIYMHKPTRVVICFDGVGGSSRRRALFKEYKENRSVKKRLNRFYDFASVEDEQESMQWQMKILHFLLRYLPVISIVADHVEADDVISYLAQHVVETDGHKAVIMSNDRDFLQLVAKDAITVWNPIKKKLMTPALVQEEYGIHVNNFLLFRMCAGDDSDNITGVHGIKEKTLLKYFPELATSVPMSVDHLLMRASELQAEQKKPSKTLQTLIDSKTILDRNYTLMRLDDVAMSGITRVKILEAFNAPIPALDKLTFTKLMITGKMVSAFPRWEDMMRSFIPLMRYSGDTHV